MKEIKILTLNIWRYYGNWEERKKKIVSYIRKENPDVIFLQECFDDGRYNFFGDNQGNQLNLALNYKYLNYSIAEMLRTESKKILKTSVFDGLACLSSMPIVEVKNFRLKQAEEDEHFRIIQKIVVQNDGLPISFYHVHFSNRDNLARMHLKETLDLAAKELLRPIIVGDFNMRMVQDLIDIAESAYEISWLEKKYFSYPLKNETLDYVLLPKGKYRFINIVCDEDELSDHRPLLAMIKLENNIREKSN